MKAAHVELGGLYLAKVSGQVVSVRIEGKYEFGGWWARNLFTHRRIRIRSAARLRPTPTKEERR